MVSDAGEVDLLLVGVGDVDEEGSLCVLEVGLVVSFYPLGDRLHINSKN